MEAQVNISGFKEMQQLLKRLPENMQRRALGSAARAGAVVMQREARKSAPRGQELSTSSKKYGPLHKNIRIIQLKRVPRGSRAYRVDTGDGFWGVILEVGSRYMPARPWMRPAIERAWGAALKKVRDSLTKALERETTKLAKQYKVK